MALVESASELAAPPADLQGGGDDALPGAGAVAALTAAMAASVVRAVAQASSAWPDAPGVAAQANALRARLIALAETNTEAYRRALRTIADPGGIAPEQRDFHVGQALRLSLIHISEPTRPY